MNDYGVTQGLGRTLEKIWALKTVDSLGWMGNKKCNMIGWDDTG